MKELVRMVIYVAATVAMIGTVIAIAKADVSGDALVAAALLIVVVLPVVIAVFIGRREKKKTTTES